MTSPNLIISQRSYLQILSHWRLGLQHLNLRAGGGDTNIQSIINGKKCHRADVDFMELITLEVVEAEDMNISFSFLIDVQ